MQVLLLAPSLFQHNSLPLDDSVKEMAWTYYPVKQGSVGVERGNLAANCVCCLLGVLVRTCMDREPQGPME